MADGAQPSRLERVAEAIAKGLRGLRETNGSKWPTDLEETFRKELGPNECMFIAYSAAQALNDAQRHWLELEIGDGLDRKACRNATLIGQKFLIKLARAEGDEKAARERETALERLRAQWAEEDAV